MKSSVRTLIDDEVKKCYCKNCDTFHDCSEHFLNSKTKNGYSYSCKATTKNYYAPPKEFTQEQIVKMESDRILERLGYDLTSPVPIYKQFLLKHDL
jgi:hypothetical protein